MLGKVHGAADPEKYVGPEPSGQELKSKDLVGKIVFVLEKARYYF
jgi:catalase (peroxidase I)